MTSRLTAKAAFLAALALAATAPAGVVVEWWGYGDRCRHKEMNIKLSKYGKEGMINPKMGKKRTEGIHGLRFDLSAIKPGTTVYRASLRLQAPLKRIRTDKRTYMSIGQGHWYYDPLRLYAEIPPWKPIEIYVAEKGSAEGKAVYDKKTRLELEAPRFRSFDATAAVRDWVAGKKPNLGFVVRQLDLWDWAPSKTVLEVRYEGKVADPPRQATGLKVVHRKGQTFIAWTETEKIITADKIYWKEFEATFKKHSPRGSTYYRIYRSSRPITAGSFASAELIDEVWPLSGYDGRVHEHVTRGEDWMGLNDKAYVPRYSIEAAPAATVKPTGKHRGGNPEWRGKQLPLHTGLYVHQVSSPRTTVAMAPMPIRSYYAVTVLTGGVENTRDFSPENSLLAPVDEKVDNGEPVLYRVLDQSRDGGRRGALRETQFFVYWAAPPYANQPRRPVHLMVGLQNPAPDKAMVIRYSIGDMYGSEINAGTHLYEWPKGNPIFSIVDVAAFGNKQYWSSWNTLKSREQAKSQPYAGRIVGHFTPWVKKLEMRLAVAEKPDK